MRNHQGGKAIRLMLPGLPADRSRLELREVPGHTNRPNF